MKRRLLAILAVVVPSAFLAGGALRVTAAPPAATSTCQNIQLTYNPVRSSGAMGHIGVMFRVHNQWRGACTLYGYPGAELLDSQFHSLPTTVERGVGYLTGNKYEHLVTLSRGHNGYFVLEWVHFPTPGQTCLGAPYLMITAPGNRLPNVIYGSAEGGAIDACGGILHVTAIQPRQFPF